MDAFRIQGGRKLTGSIEIGGAKNGVLPMLAGALLIPGRAFIRKVPHLRDVVTMMELLQSLGASGGYTDHCFEVDASNLTSHEAPWEIVRRMRASIYVLGPLLARMGKARVSLPGGCAWGPRPVDLHIRGMRALGAEVNLEQGYVVASAPPGGLRGGRIGFEISSVGATGNVMMAACLARGSTVIENAAREPDIVALADFLNAAGARIQGQGTTTLIIEGVSELHAVEFTNIPDRIEVGTYLAAAAITSGDVTLTGVRPDHVGIVLDRLQEMGVGLEVGQERIRVQGPEPGSLRSVNIMTQPYPGFPTDLQAQFIALLCLADGTGVVTDTIYTDRFTHVPELRRLGANIDLHQNVATVRGVKALEGAHVTSTDIRASSALVLAGLVARGETHVHRVYHIDRGYEAIEKRLRGLGAEIERYAADGP